MGFLQDHLASQKNLILVLSTFAITSTSLLLLALLRLAQILPTPTSQNADSSAILLPQRPPSSSTNPTHLLIVLGSGGHTAEMLNILSSISDLSQLFTRRTYIVSSGDSFSTSKAVEFEKEHVRQDSKSENMYTIVTVRRARRVHQSFLSTPVSALLSLQDCIAVLMGRHKDLHKTVQNYIYPDLILTNGPGTGVCVVLAALLLRFFGFGGLSRSLDTPPQQPEGGIPYAGQGQMRTIFIESWARVKTLSLSGKILQPLVNRFLVQWPQLAEVLGEGVEYIGPLVS